MNYTYEQLAKMIDHSLLHPTMTDRDLEDGCRIAAKYGVASVCIKPYAVQRAVELLAGSGVLVGAVIGFPHGNSTTESKRYETKLACEDGAAEIDMVINIGALKSGDDCLVEDDIRAVVEAAHENYILCKVIIETALLNDQEKVRACLAAKNAGADFVKTSTGFAKGGATADSAPGKTSST